MCAHNSARRRRILMEREFSLSACLKLAKKLWYVLLIAIIVCGAIGTVYAVVFSGDKSQYVVDASVRVNIFYANPPRSDAGTSGETTGEVSLFTTTTSADFSKVYNAVFDEDFNNVMIAELKKFGFDIKEGDSVKSFYTIKAANQAYQVTITMADRTQALKMGDLFVTTVCERLEGDKVAAILDVYGYQGYVAAFVDPPAINSEKSSGALAWYLGLLIGLVAGCAIYAVVVLIAYFYNPKYLNVDEFSSQYDIAVLEGDSLRNGLVNAAIKVKLALDGIDGVKTLAVNKECNAEALLAGLQAIGAKADMVNVMDIAADLSKLEEAIDAEKASHKDCEYLLIVASGDAERKDYLMLADVADGAMLSLSLDTKYKEINNRIVELSELKNINLIGVVF